MCDNAQSFFCIYLKFIKKAVGRLVAIYRAISSIYSLFLLLIGSKVIININLSPLLLLRRFFSPKVTAERDSTLLRAELLSIEQLKRHAIKLAKIGRASCRERVSPRV